MRIADAIRRAGGPKPDVYLGHVLVTRLAADSSRVQMRASLRDSLGTVANDFLLQDNDLIEVFSMSDLRAERYVSIGGAVRKPGRYAYRRGMTIRDLVLLADGLQESAYLKDAEIARLPRDRSGGRTAITMQVPLDSSYVYEAIADQRYAAGGATGNGAAPAADVPLEPYDNVLIKQQPNWQLQRTVIIGGEIAFPGQYALTSRDERLADLVGRAGGLTAEAYPEGTVFLRRKGNIGRVAIDVPMALKKSQSPENLVLVDGDEISIPPRSFVVTVTGAVNAPNVVAHVPGMGLDYYIQQAGGALRNADKRGAYVTQPNGKREVGGWVRDPKPLAGSTVEVPVDPTPRASWHRHAGAPCCCRGGPPPLGPRRLALGTARSHLHRPPDRDRCLAPDLLPHDHRRPVDAPRVVARLADARPARLAARRRGRRDARAALLVVEHVG